MEKMIKLCIFDMDGLLIDSERQMWFPSEIQTLKEMNQEVDMEFLRSLMGSTNAYSVHLLKQRYGEDFDTDLFYEKVGKYNNEAVEEGRVPLREGVRELLSYIKEKGIATVVGTSSDRKYTEKILGNLGVCNYFDKIVCGHDVNRSKPAPDIYLKAWSFFDVLKEETLIFEDAHNGALAAIASGCKLALVPDLAPLSDEDLSNATYVLKRIDEVIPYLV